MKWFKRILLSLLILLGIIIIGSWLTLQLTPKPVSLFVRKQFDTSQKTQVYDRPNFFNENMQEITITTDEKYPSENENNILDVYAPKNLKENVPVLFWVHGGAYVGGDKRDCKDYLTMLCAQTKTIVVNLNYALAPEAKHPTPVQQLNEAIVAIKQSKLRIDWDNIRLGGDSAGAQIASEYLLSLTNNNLQVKNHLKPALESSQVRKFISLSGLLEPDKFTEIDDTVSSFLFKQSGWAYFGDKNFSNREEIKNLSLAKHAKEFSQDFFFTDGNQKTFTKQMDKTVDALKKQNLSVTKISYDKPELGHEYQFDFNKPEAEKTFKKLVHFLNS
ncbi:lipase [Enterococcus saigonensis]|uniref:Lipase n=1 Tax=Enterococcus saigonensis TaxID=1805431 RepID=A0A679ICD7_9ENTE|nr:alpha/beta hydrolase [Enterococcus saigonensis]BCA85883.1 lipase [Enterococcus saigonensis]